MSEEFWSNKKKHCPKSFGQTKKHCLKHLATQLSFYVSALTQNRKLVSFCIIQLQFCRFVVLIDAMGASGRWIKALVGFTKSKSSKKDDNVND